MGYAEEQALRAIRISTGSFTTLEDIEILITQIKELIQKFQ